MVIESLMVLGRMQMYMQPVYLHVTRGLNGSQTGLVLLPSSIVGSASSLYAGWHMSVSPLPPPSPVYVVFLMLTDSSQHYKEYKSFQAVMSVIPWIQALSIMVGWGPETSLNRLWLEMAVGALGGGATITTLLSEHKSFLQPGKFMADPAQPPLSHVSRYVKLYFQLTCRCV